MLDDGHRRDGLSSGFSSAGGPRATVARLTALARRINSSIPDSVKSDWAARDADPLAFSLAIFSDEARRAQVSPLLRLAGPGTAFIYRDYGRKDRARRGRHVRQICRQRGIAFLVGADPALALALDADGLHLPEYRLDDATALRGRFRWLTAACHSPAALARARAGGVDAAFISPVFPTRSHPGQEPLGLRAATALACAAGLPVLALGGVNALTAPRLVGTGFAGFGAIGAFG